MDTDIGASTNGENLKEEDKTSNKQQAGQRHKRSNTLGVPQQTTRLKARVSWPNSILTPEPLKPLLRMIPNSTPLPRLQAHDASVFTTTHRPAVPPDAEELDHREAVLYYVYGV